jgi:hypothetical protein
MEPSMVISKSKAAKNTKFRMKNKQQTIVPEIKINGPL